MYYCIYMSLSHVRGGELEVGSDEIFEKEFDLHNQKLKHLKERRQMLFQNQEQINNEYGHYLILTRAISA